MKAVLIKIKGFIEKSLQKDSVLLVLSVLLAVFIWGYITTRESPDAWKYISDVAVDYEGSIAGTPAEAEGYRIYDADISKVDIRVAANRKQLGFLSKDLFTARISIDKYSGEQPVTAKLQIYKTDDNDIMCDYSLKDSKNNKVKVYFYKEITRTFDVRLKAPGITAAEGYKLKGLNCDSLSVTGPEPYVNMISECVLEIPQNVEYDSSKSISVTADLSSLTFCNENGDDINNLIRPYMNRDQFKINKSDLTVMINISRVKNVDITYGLVNVPEYFNQQFIKDRLSLSTSALTVSSDDPSIDEMDALPVSSDQNIPLNRIGLDFSTSFDLSKALESYPKLNNDTSIHSAYVTFDSSGLAEKKFDSIAASRFTVKNPYSSKYSAELVTQALNDVILIGPEKDIEKITADDLTIDIDLSKSAISDTGKINTGIVTYKVSFILPPEYKNVWVYGDDYSADVNISELYPAETMPQTTQAVSQ